MYCICLCVEHLQRLRFVFTPLSCSCEIRADQKHIKRACNVSTISETSCISRNMLEIVDWCMWCVALLVRVETSVL